MTHDATTMAAAELADRYIEIVLATKPELLVYNISGTDPDKVPRYAAKLLDFRQQMINGLKEQPIPPSDRGD